MRDDRASRPASSSDAWCRRNRARGRTASPAAVRLTPLALRRRSNSVCSDRSSLVTANDRADGETCSFAAAVLIVPASATATKAAS